jgi:hypothetical protein
MIGRIEGRFLGFLVVGSFMTRFDDRKKKGRLFGHCF